MTKTEGELQYWDKAIFQDHTLRYTTAIEVMKIPKEHRILLDWGCGPLGGVLPYLKAEVKIGVDPLWDEYEKYRIDLKDIYTYSIGCPINVDTIVTINAIDHGNSNFNALRRFHFLLNPGGKLYLHVNLRTKEELNETHDHLLRLEDFHEIANGLFNITYEKVYEHDPLPWSDSATVTDPYKTLVAVMERI